MTDLEILCLAIFSIRSMGLVYLPTFGYSSWWNVGVYLYIYIQMYVYLEIINDPHILRKIWPHKIFSGQPPPKNRGVQLGSRYINYLSHWIRGPCPSGLSLASSRDRNREAPHNEAKAGVPKHGPPGRLPGSKWYGCTPKSSILIGFSIINHPFLGTTIFGNIHISNFCLKGSCFP